MLVADRLKLASDENQQYTAKSSTHLQPFHRRSFYELCRHILTYVVCRQIVVQIIFYKLSYLLT